MYHLPYVAEVRGLEVLGTEPVEGLNSGPGSLC